MSSPFNLDLIQHAPEWLIVWSPPWTHASHVAECDKTSTSALAVSTKTDTKAPPYGLTKKRYSVQLTYHLNVCFSFLFLSLFCDDNHLTTIF